MAVDTKTTRRSAKAAPPAVKGLTITRRFTRPGVHPFDGLEWEKRSAAITSDKGEVIFEQKDVEIPAAWSQLATNVVVSKYFRGAIDTPDRETSVKQLIERVAGTIAQWGRKDGYFATEEDADAFYGELTHILVHQMVCFNSPVWFNVGIEARPQCSACFINSVDDTLDSILELAKTEGMLFKWGSGTGTNLSPIRSSRERLSTGGWASGPVSFMRGYDAFAGVIKSGGKTRRAAKMQILNIDHPDVRDFITCKMNEERKAWALIDAGYDGSINGEAYSSVFFQNANLSVRVTDEFMQAALEDRPWETHAIRGGRVVDTWPARELLRLIAEGTWICGDPGMQFDTTVNHWHPCIHTDRIHSSNPCSEYMFLDNTACNLASLNLLRFRRPDGEFDVDAFKHAVDITITAQEILVDNASYPTKKIGENSHEYRPLGLGYANLGALLMARGLPYDGDEGREYAAAVTSIMCGRAYRQSAVIARDHGWAFGGYEKNREPFLRVMNQHRAAAYKIPVGRLPADLLGEARRAWDEAVGVGEDHGFRNAQATVLAPTGTIAFMMDCDTTGVEPDIALVKYKKLVGGGVLKIVNRTVPEALRRLGYTEDQVNAVVAFIDEHETIEGAPDLKPEHLPVFDCAFKARNGTRSIHYMGHVRMMGAVQPFISGAISKTVNLPNEASVEEIIQAYVEGWKHGLKAIAIYRDGCKRSQPLNAGKDEEKAAGPAQPDRRRLPDEREAITHKFDIAGHEGYITVGKYEDGRAGEIFVTMAKEGSMTSGLMDALATMVSIALQYGVPLKVLCDKLSHTRFEPSGVTNNKDIPIAKSITDYIFRWLALKFLSGPEAAAAAPPAPAIPAKPAGPAPKVTVQKLDAAPANGNGHGRAQAAFRVQIDAPPCPTCGSIMTSNGACYKCDNCGSTSGCS